MTEIQVLLSGAVILIGSIEKSFKFMTKRTYHCIQDDGPHSFARRRKARQYRDRKFKYSMLASYGAQAAQGLYVHPPRGLTTPNLLSHK